MLGLRGKRESDVTECLQLKRNFFFLLSAVGRCLCQIDLMLIIVAIVGVKLT